MFESLVGGTDDTLSLSLEKNLRVQFADLTKAVIWVYHI